MKSGERALLRPFLFNEHTVLGKYPLLTLLHQQLGSMHGLESVFR